jgi:DNA primase
MGTALTPEQLAELRRAAGTVYLALDADSAGQDAMLRAARAARELEVELLVVDMPEGLDPAELVGEHGPDAFRERIENARDVPDFQARRVVAQADLSTSRGRDAALEEVRPLVAALARKPATRDELVRYLSDRLDVPRDYLLGRSAPAPRAAAPPAGPDRFGSHAAPVVPQRLDAVSVERSFLRMCFASEMGREYVERLTDDHLSSAMLRRLRDHLVAHWDDPLASLPEDDPTLVAWIKDVVMRADDIPVSDDGLRLDFLKLDRRRVERQLRHATESGDFARGRSLQQERQRLKDQIDELMGATL